MTYRLEFEAAAINSAAGFLTDDPAGLREALLALDALVDDRRPENSTEFGSAEVRRLRVGRYRALYTIASDVITVTHLGRTPNGQ